MDKYLKQINDARDFLLELNKRNETSDEVMGTLFHGLLLYEAEIAKSMDLDDEEKAMLDDSKGMIINAIKHFRVRTNCGLYAAKMAIDNYRSSH